MGNSSNDPAHHTSMVQLFRADNFSNNSPGGPPGLLTPALFFGPLVKKRWVLQVFCVENLIVCSEPALERLLVRIAQAQYLVHGAQRCT